MNENIELVRSFYESYRSGDFEAFTDLCHDDLEWIQNEGFPYGGHHHGPQQVIDGVFLTLGRHWAEFRFDVQQILDAGSSIVVLGAYEGRHRETDKSFRADAAHVFDIAGGKILRFRQFADTALILAAAS